MLQSRSSPSLFQQHQYGSAHSRRNSIATSRRPVAPSPTSSPALAPPPRPVHYVSRGTQYSPMIEKMADLPAEPTLEPLMPSQPENSIPKESASVVPVTENLPPKTVLQADSPSIKRRQEREDVPVADGGEQDTLVKRIKPEQAPVKLLPVQYEFCEVEDMVILIADMISELIATNDELPLRQGVLTRFHSRTPPGISVKDYLHRLAKHATLTPPLLLSMVYYIDRLCLLYPAFTITTLTVHRFLITAATVAAKGLSDSFWNNATYARVGGIKIAELGLLELDFLYRVDWKIVPNPEVLVDYYRGLIKRSDGYVLQGDEGVSEEEDSTDSAECADSPEVKSEAITNDKWNEWMDDVSSQNAVKVAANEGTDAIRIKKEES